MPGMRFAITAFPEPGGPDIILCYNFSPGSQSSSPLINLTNSARVLNGNIFTLRLFYLGKRLPVYLRQML